MAIRERESIYPVVLFSLFASGVLITLIKLLNQENGGLVTEYSAFDTREVSRDGEHAVGTQEQWDEKHCINGGRHEMNTSGYQVSKGHLRLRWDCENCPYWYLT